MDQSILSEIKEKAKACWKKDLVSVVLFGSFVKDGKYNDIDVLIVVEDIKKSRIDRTEDIIKFSDTVDVERPLDVLLYSRREVESNFRNHNPLFLDITLDGMVIYDKRGFASDLIDETSEYLTSHNIFRKGTRWVFPFRRGVYALSKVTNKDWIMVWLEDSDRDLLSAKTLHEKDLFEKSVYHCQQCGEKAVKAVILCLGSFEKTHKVSQVLEDEARDKKLLSEEIVELVELSKFLEPAVSLSRYPGLSNDKMWVPSREYDSKSSLKYIDKAEKALLISKKFVEEWLK